MPQNPSLRKNSLLPLHLTFLTLSSCILSATNSIHVDWDFESPAYIEYESIARGNNGWYHFYHEDGDRSNVPTDDTANGDIFLTSDIAYTGDQSIAFQLFEHTNTFKDRVELQIAEWHRGSALKFGDERFVGYRIYIDDISGPFKRHFMQVWQPNCGSKVPFTMTFTNEHGDWRWEASARDFDMTDNFATQPISKGQWHTFVFRFLPHYDEESQDGEIEIWLNGKIVASYIGPWSEKPGNILPGYDPVKDTMTIRCGLYGGPGGVHRPEQSIAFDDIRMGTTFSEANPADHIIEFEAEDGQLTGSLAVYGHTDASFGQYIEEPDGTTGQGTAEYQFSIPSAGDYNVWLLAYGETPGDDSIYVSIDGGSDTYCGIPTGSTFAWRKLFAAGGSTLTYSLSSGSHTLKLKRREKGAKIDKIVLLPVGALKPSSLNQKTHIGIEAEKGRIQTPFAIYSEVGASGGDYIMQPIGSSSTGFAEFDFHLTTSGNYNIWLLARGDSGSTDSVKVSVNGSTDINCSVNIGSDFTWKKLNQMGGSTVKYTLGPGFHTLKISKREAGTKIDRIVIVEENVVFEP